MTTTTTQPSTKGRCYQLPTTSSSSSSTPLTIDPFQPNADLYAMARPTYPAQLIETIVSSLSSNNNDDDDDNSPRRKFPLAVDVGAGSGQLTFALAPYFDKVLAIDKSAAQLEQQKQHRLQQARKQQPQQPPFNTSTTTSSSADSDSATKLILLEDDDYSNVEFQQGLATDLTKIWQSQQQQQPAQQASSSSSFSSSSSYPKADLVTCAQMYHWLLADGTSNEFLQQVSQILHPTCGILAVLGYSLPSIVNHPKLQQVFLEDYYVKTLRGRDSPDTPGYPWSIDRRIVDSQYATVTFPGFTIVQRWTINDMKSIPLSTFIAYMKSMSAYQAIMTSMQKQRQEEEVEHKKLQYTTTSSSRNITMVDPMERIQQRMYEIASSPEIMVDVQYPFFLILLKPNPNES